MDAIVICDTYELCFEAASDVADDGAETSEHNEALLNAHLGISVEFQGKNGIN